MEWKRSTYFVLEMEHLRPHFGLMLSSLVRFNDAGMIGSEDGEKIVDACFCERLQEEVCYCSWLSINPCLKCPSTKDRSCQASCPRM